jgi:hypothetical protein
MAGAVRIMADKVTLNRRLVNTRIGIGFKYRVKDYSGTDREPAVFGEDAVPVEFIPEFSRVAEIVFLDDQQGITDLTDLEQKPFVLIEEPDPVVPQGVCREGDDDVSVLRFADHA